MEDNLQRIFSIIISIIIFFLLPMYMAYEKTDDISYALALKITSGFMDNVRSKGYISLAMYSDFVSRLNTATNNKYEIKMEHVAKKYNPAFYIYSDDNSKIIATLDYQSYKDKFTSSGADPKKGSILYNGTNYNNVVLSYKLDEERYNENTIIDVLHREPGSTDNPLTIYSDFDNYARITFEQVPYITNMYGTEDNSLYTMSTGDEFNIIVKNENVTIASTLFNTLTLGTTSSEIVKIYINYGVTIANESYEQ